MMLAEVVGSTTENADGIVAIPRTTPWALEYELYTSKTLVSDGKNVLAMNQTLGSNCNFLFLPCDKIVTTIFSSPLCLTARLSLSLVGAVSTIYSGV